VNPNLRQTEKTRARSSGESVDLRRFQKGLRAVVGAAAELSGERLPRRALQIADRDQLGPGDRPQADRVPAPDPPAADDAEPDSPRRALMLRGTRSHPAARTSAVGRKDD
jgi:hypothetical protein